MRGRKRQRKKDARWFERKDSVVFAEKRTIFIGKWPQEWEGAIKSIESKMDGNKS